MKNILIPCDFSRPAINAYRFALDIAEQSNGSIHLLNVVELPVIPDNMLISGVSFEQPLLKELKEEMDKQFYELLSKYNSEYVKVTSSVQFGHVFKVVQKYILEQGIDLVLIGSHGVSGLREFFIGSNTEKVVRNSPVPVLVIKDYYKGPIKNIAFPVNIGYFNNFDAHHLEQLVTKVKGLQAFFKAHLHLVWINTPGNFASDTVSRKRLDEFAQRFMLQDYTTNVFNHSDEEHGIAEFANAIHADLVAIGTHGRKGVAHLLSGSLAEKIVNHNRGLVWTYALNDEHVLA